MHEEEAGVAGEYLVIARSTVAKTLCLLVMR